MGNALTGVAAQSKPNVAVQYILGGNSLGNTATLKPASSKTKYFSLQSFYFGCVPSSQETAAGAAIACTLTLTGKRNGKVVAATLVRPDDEIMLITDSGVLVRTRVAEIRELGRATQGVTLIALDDGARLTGLQRIVENDASLDAAIADADAGADSAPNDGEGA